MHDNPDALAQDSSLVHPSQPRALKQAGELGTRLAQEAPPGPTAQPTLGNGTGWTPLKNLGDRQLLKQRIVEDTPALAAFVGLTDLADTLAVYLVDRCLHDTSGRRVREQINGWLADFAVLHARALARPVSDDDFRQIIGQAVLQGEVVARLETKPPELEVRLLSLVGSEKPALWAEAIRDPLAAELAHPATAGFIPDYLEGLSQEVRAKSEVRLQAYEVA
jgi:hypothetical protein